jgi:hypothetical protein
MAPAQQSGEFLLFLLAMTRAEQALQKRVFCRFKIWKKQRLQRFWVKSRGTWIQLCEFWTKCVCFRKRWRVPRKFLPRSEVFGCTDRIFLIALDRNKLESSLVQGV